MPSLSSESQDQPEKIKKWTSQKKLHSTLQNNRINPWPFYGEKQVVMGKQLFFFCEKYGINLFHKKEKWFCGISLLIINKAIFNISIKYFLC